MKKFIYSVLAVATMMFATTSCSNEDVLTPVESQSTKKVTFKVEMPGETASRAIADGVNVAQANMANKLAWALYESSKVDEEPVLTGNATKAADSKEFSVEIDMVKGLEYKVLFLAYCDGGTIFDVTPGDDLKSLNYNSTVVSNQEAYDAFVACHTHTVNDEAVTTVTLKRPFAQINAATTDADLERAGRLQATVTHSSLTIAKVPTQYNVLTGEASEYKDVTYGFGAILKDYSTQANEILTVENANYNYLNMVYVLADATSSTHSATFTFYRNSDEADAIRTIDIVNLPIQRNYRTNVIGDLITQTEAFKIVIDEKFDGDHNVSGSEQAATTTTVATMAELQAAIDAANGPTIIKFEQDIDANSSRAVAGVTILQKAATDLVIDGCGFKFDGQITVNGNARSTGSETLTFRNIKFSTASTEKFTFIDAPSKIDNKYNYSHNVTIEDCDFEYTGSGLEIGSASFTGTYNFVMKNCTATNMHSLLQVQSCDNTATVENVTVTNCKNGISFGNTAYPTIKNSTINATAYGIRGDGNASRGNLVIENTAIKAEKPVIIRKMTTDGYAVALEGENTLTTTGMYDIVFTTGDDAAEFVAPAVSYTITGAENFNVFPVQDPSKPKVATNAAQFKAYLADASMSEILLGEGAVIEGAFDVKRTVSIKSVNADNKATIIGRVNIANANPTFENVIFDRNTEDSDDAWDTSLGSSNCLQYKAVVMIYGNQTNTITFKKCDFYNNNGLHKSAITNTACDLSVDACYFEGKSSSIYSQTNLSITNSKFDYTGGNNVVVSLNGCGDNGGKFVFTGNEIVGEKIFTLSQFLSTTAFGNGTYNFDVKNNTGAGFEHYFLNTSRVTNKTFAEGSETF